MLVLSTWLLTLSIHTGAVRELLIYSKAGFVKSTVSYELFHEFKETAVMREQTVESLFEEEEGGFSISSGAGTHRWLSLPKLLKRTMNEQN